LRIAVVREIVVDLPFDLFTNVLREREIRLAQVAFDDLMAGPLDLGNIGAHFECIFSINEGCSIGKNVHSSFSLRIGLSKFIT